MSTFETRARRAGPGLPVQSQLELRLPALGTEAAAQHMLSSGPQTLCSRRLCLRNRFGRVPSELTAAAKVAPSQLLSGLVAAA